MKITKDKKSNQFNIKCSKEDLEVIYALFYRTALGGDFSTPIDFMNEVDDLLVIDTDAIAVEIETEHLSKDKIKVFNEDKHNLSIYLIKQ